MYKLAWQKRLENKIAGKRSDILQINTTKKRAESYTNYPKKIETKKISHQWKFYIYWSKARITLLQTNKYNESSRRTKGNQTFKQNLKYFHSKKERPKQTERPPK